MIAVDLIGGLGNQLFQYAAARMLALKHNVELKVNVLGFETYKLHKYSLQHFDIKGSMLTAAEAQKYTTSVIGRAANKLAQKADLDIYFGKTYKERKFEFDPMFLKLPSDVFITGFWQSEKYFKESEAQIRQDLQIITPISGLNKEVADKIKSSNAVSLHIRRGDYVKDSTTQKIHGTCDLDYYARSIAEIASKQADPHFFVFSDDPEWTVANLKIDYPCIFVTHNDADTNFEDLRLMSLCKHHIVANSSFSWWGAWLNQNPEKIVIAPARWFNESNRNTKDLIPDQWMKI